jgi:deoxycytidine triphosphate deaminase
MPPRFHQTSRRAKKILLSQGETIVLRPNELLLGRTLEEFTLPNGYVGEITGRSSFARMGIQVNATGGLVQPGWRGHMPLQLINFGPNPVRLVPGLPMCQLRIAKLSSLAERPYGDPSLNSLYMNEEGGPSYWWRDKRIQELHAKLAGRSVEMRIQQSLDAVIRDQEPEVFERLERIVDRLPVSELLGADTILESFVANEERRRAVRRWVINLSRALFSVGISASLWAYNKPPFDWRHYLTWGIAVFTVLLSLYAFRTEVGDHFGRMELKKARAKP